MQKEYIGTVGNRHELTKYTLSNNTEITLNDEEIEELFYNTDLYLDIKAELLELEAEVSYIDSEADELREALEYEEDTNDSLLKEIETLKEELDKFDKYK